MYKNERLNSGAFFGTNGIHVVNNIVHFYFFVYDDHIEHCTGKITYKETRQ